MHHLSSLDLPGRLAGILPRWAVILGCAVFGVGVSALLRLLADQFAPGVAPYAFIYPACLLATLLGGWPSGIGTVAIGGFLAWEFVVPKAVQSGGSMNYQAAAAVITALTACAAVAVAEIFRRAAVQATAAHDAKLKERDLLFAELKHRVGNDFAIVASLLDLQRRRSNEPATRAALEQAMARVRSISRVHRQLYAVPETEVIDLRDYLRDLCAGLTDATLPPAGVRLSCECDQAYMPRERVLALGLAINELVMNAVRHAFPEGRDGIILVRFSRFGAGWRLEVADNGVGLDPGQRKAGLGTGLIEQFVRQAGGNLTLESRGGTQAYLDLPASAASSTPG
ncbi:MAG: sensor histidine kinase [Alphaproteobacteria bacterium]|nr:sensor histidine kinase [Alphaproteobacteria bacterium]